MVFRFNSPENQTLFVCFSAHDYCCSSKPLTQPVELQGFLPRNPQASPVDL